MLQSAEKFHSALGRKLRHVRLPNDFLPQCA
jgi:hypothetical protein